LLIRLAGLLWGLPGVELSFLRVSEAGYPVAAPAGACFNRAMRPAPAPDPERTGSYLICATPRTGSSLLCGLLDSTGVAGHPESWFRRQDEREFAAEGIQPYPVLYEELAADPVRTATGVLGFLGLDLPRAARSPSGTSASPTSSTPGGLKATAAVPDPREGVAADGTIVTGADRGRVPAAFEPVLADAVAFSAECGASLYVYGSVANGTVRPGLSDVDLLSVDLTDPAGVGQILSARYADLCRAVEISAATAADLAGDSDTAYGFRVFLRHYCVHLAGPNPSATLPAFPADARAARGFNGDIAWYHRRWQRALESGTAPAGLLGVRAARKTLLAVAGLVSVHDRTWTTGRARAALRWGQIEPGLAAPLGQLLSWAAAQRRPASEEVRLALAADGIVAAVVDRFAGLIGLWPDDPQSQGGW